MDSWRKQRTWHSLKGKESKVTETDREGEREGETETEREGGRDRERGKGRETERQRQNTAHSMCHPCTGRSSFYLAALPQHPELCFANLLGSSQIKLPIRISHCTYAEKNKHFI